MVLFYSGYWINTHFEQHCEAVEIGLQGVAADNPLLAAQRLLERMGSVVITTTSVIKLKQLGSQDTLILWGTDGLFDATQTQQLLNWVEAGGHLIIASNTVFNGSENSSNPLLQQLKIYRLEDKLQYLPQNQIIAATPLTWENKAIQIAFDPHYRLEYTDDPAIEILDDYGTHFLFYYYGTGMISLLSDMQFIHNQAIGQYDHAQFLWSLVQFERPARQIWLLRLPNLSGITKTATNNIPSLRQLVWFKWWAVVISASILLLFWLWHIMSRFGPLLPDPPGTRRRLLEHIEASGHFLWRYHQTKFLLRGARQAVLNKLASVHPDWIRLSPSELSQHLAPLGKLSAEEIEEALYNIQPQTEIAFTQAIRILTQIRKML
ncbi:hypothetical protein THII_0130 [Thioploca ingrica]|uniref:DUF4350 domain-containing protein n=1 Tax=Thioploca ingrica TaxID=40754 RepID=A0A090AGS2_9GAMM|nr:hypothetical protein THII_0130 [Thioploca ingrica]